MKKYLIDWGTMEETYKTSSLDDVKKYVDNNTGFNQQSIIVYDEGGNEIARRQWWNNEFDPDLYEDGKKADVITYGRCGYYDVWEDNGGE